MKKKYALLVLLFLGWTTNYAQVFEVVPIQNSGNPNKYINLVIMGDGYTVDQQDDFIETATNISNYLFSISPW